MYLKNPFTRPAISKFYLTYTDGKKIIATNIYIHYENILKKLQNEIKTN